MLTFGYVRNYVKARVFNSTFEAYEWVTVHNSHGTEFGENMIFNKISQATNSNKVLSLPKIFKCNTNARRTSDLRRQYNSAGELKQIVDSKLFYGSDKKKKFTSAEEKLFSYLYKKNCRNVIDYTTSIGKNKSDRLSFLISNPKLLEFWNSLSHKRIYVKYTKNFVDQSEEKILMPILASLNENTGFWVKTLRKNCESINRKRKPDDDFINKMRSLVTALQSLEKTNKIGISSRARGFINCNINGRTLTNFGSQELGKPLEFLEDDFTKIKESVLNIQLWIAGLQI